MQPSGLPIFLAAQGRNIKHLIKVGAVNEETAVFPAQAALVDNAVLHKLTSQGFLGRTAEGKLFVNTERLSRNLVWKNYILKHEK